MQHLFTHGTRGEKTKQTEICGEQGRTIGEIPERWEVVELSSICDYATRKLTWPVYISGSQS